MPEEIKQIYYVKVFCILEDDSMKKIKVFSDWTVGRLKLHLFYKGLVNKSNKLFFRTKELKDDSLLLSDEGIGHSSILNVVKESRADIKYSDFLFRYGPTILIAGIALGIGNFVGNKFLCKYYTDFRQFSHVLKK